MYGTTIDGGIYGDGTVYELSGAGDATCTTLASFSGTNGPATGENPSTALISDSSGNLYGTTATGGALGYGTVFELSGVNHNIYTLLVSFTGANGTAPGENPEGLNIGGSGTIYGATNGNTLSGGSIYGTVFSLSGTAHTTFTSVFTFALGIDTEPNSPLALDGNGNLYGTTYYGGANNDGSVFELSGTAHSQYSTLISFTGTSGADPGMEPVGGLLIDGAGNIYGTTFSGGASDDGTAYELSGASHMTFTSLATFTGTSGAVLGALPQCQLVADSAGNLYGTTYQGGTTASEGDGTVFELSGTAHMTFTSLASFNFTAGGDSSGPRAGVIVDSSGNLHGTTYGSNNGSGMVFMIAATSRSVLITLYNFQPQGFFGGASPIVDGNGNIIGCDVDAGVADEGTIFELSGPGHSVYTTLVSFTGISGTAPGQAPLGLVFDSNGNIYGITNTGGASNDGTVFELSGANYQTFSSLVSFTGTAGAYPGEFAATGLTYDRTTGNIYGATREGGASNDGTIFSLADASHSFSSLASFTGTSGATPGQYPQSPPVVGSSGNLYGTVAQGTTNSDGGVFELTGSTHTTFQLLVSFSGNINTPAEPTGKLVFDSSGNLYGTSVEGGNLAVGMYGTVFELTAPSYTTVTLLTAMGQGNQLEEPFGGVVFGADGNLYGTTTQGGIGLGSVYELSGSGLTILTRISSTSYGPLGVSPSDALSEDASGNLYGETVGGGTYNFGTIFEISRNAGAGLVAIAGTTTIAPPNAVDGIKTEYFNRISVGAGASLVTTPSVTPTVLQSPTLTIAGTAGGWTGEFDLSNNDLDLSGATLAIAFSQVSQGYNNGTWTGQGITSSIAAVDSTHRTAIGVIKNNQSGTAIYSLTNLFDGTAPGASDILVKYTYYGDANLDGKVDGSDYTKIDAGFNSQKTATPLSGWLNGDFNYDGKIDGSDYTLIDNAFNRQGMSLAAQIAAVATHPSTNNASPSAVFSTASATAANVFGSLDDKRRRVVEDICV